MGDPQYAVLHARLYGQREAGGANSVRYAQREGYRVQHLLHAIDRNEPLFAAYPEALAHTGEIAGRCQVELNCRALALAVLHRTPAGDAARRMADNCLPDRLASPAKSASRSAWDRGDSGTVQVRRRRTP